MNLIKRDSVLWSYFPEEVQELIETGETVLGFVYKQSDAIEISDYAFCVFSFAKAYEGFLKKLFLDMGLIARHEYYGDDIRIGRILSPYFMKEKGNVFYRICGPNNKGKDLSHRLWSVWKNGRNLVFHYFPHNYRRLNYPEAYEIIISIVDAMTMAVENCIHDKPEHFDDRPGDAGNSGNSRNSGGGRHGKKGRNNKYKGNNNYRDGSYGNNSEKVSIIHA